LEAHLAAAGRGTHLADSHVRADAEIEKFEEDDEERRSEPAEHRKVLGCRRECLDHDPGAHRERDLYDAGVELSLEAQHKPGALGTVLDVLDTEEGDDTENRPLRPFDMQPKPGSLIVEPANREGVRVVTEEDGAGEPRDVSKPFRRIVH